MECVTGQNTTEEVLHQNVQGIGRSNSKNLRKLEESTACMALLGKLQTVCQRRKQPSFL